MAHHRSGVTALSSSSILSGPNTNSSNSSSNSAPVLYPQLESSTAPLDGDLKYLDIIKIEKDLVACLRKSVKEGNPLEDVGDLNILPGELLASDSKKSSKPKVDPLKRLKELPTEEAEEEEEPEDEENEDEEAAEDEEDDAGGDYLVSHFDNGEGYEDNDEDGDEMTPNF